MLDLSLADNFIHKYSEFIEEKTFTLLPTGYVVLFDGWVNDIFVVIGEQNNKNDNKTCFCFGNIPDAVKIRHLDLYIKRSDENGSPYKNFDIPTFKNKMPKEFKDCLINKRHLTKGKDKSSFHRIIASCVFDLEDKEGKLKDLFDYEDRPKEYNHALEVHHIEPDTYFNKIENLIPLERNFHNSWVHRHFEPDSNSIDMTHNDFKLLKDKIIKIQKLNKKNNWSIFNQDDKILFIAYYYHYIEAKSSRSFFDNLKIKGVKLPCGKSMQNYIKANRFREFQAFYESQL